MQTKKEDKPVIVFTDEEWAKLSPLREKWKEPAPRLKEIANELEKLSVEAKMLKSSADYWKSLFWDAVSAKYPHTRNLCLQFEEDPPRVETVVHDEAGAIELLADVKSILAVLLRGHKQ